MTNKREAIESLKSEIIEIRQNQVDLTRDTTDLDSVAISKLTKRLELMNAQAASCAVQIHALQGVE